MTTSIKKLVIGMVVISLIFVNSPVARSIAASVPISNYQWYRQVFAWNAAFDSVPIELNGQTYQTGPITMTLDPSYPLAASYEVYDFRDMSQHKEYRLLVDAPLLSSLGAGPQHFHMVTVGGPGTISVTPDTIDDTNWTAITVTSLVRPSTVGTFDDGQILSGWVYSNHDDDPPPTEVQPNPGSTIRDAVEERNRQIEDLGMHDAKLTDPMGTVYVLGTSTGVGTVELGPVPEPSTLLILICGVAAVPVYRFRRASRAG